MTIRANYQNSINYINRMYDNTVIYDKKTEYLTLWHCRDIARLYAQFSTAFKQGFCGIDAVTALIDVMRYRDSRNVQCAINRMTEHSLLLSHTANMLTVVSMSETVLGQNSQPNDARAINETLLRHYSVVSKPEHSIFQRGINMCRYGADIIGHVLASPLYRQFTHKQVC